MVFIRRGETHALNLSVSEDECYWSSRGRYAFPYTFDTFSSCSLAKMRHCQSGADIRPPAFDVFSSYCEDKTLVVRRGGMHPPELLTCPQTVASENEALLARQGRHTSPRAFNASSSHLPAKIRRCWSGGGDMHPPELLTRP
jgi:hypothetical protein